MQVVWKLTHNITLALLHSKVNYLVTSKGRSLQVQELYKITRPKKCTPGKLTTHIKQYSISDPIAVMDFGNKSQIKIEPIMEMVKLVHYLTCMTYHQLQQINFK